MDSKNLRLLGGLAIAALFSASSAFGSLTLSTNTYTSAGGGGEFTVKPVAPGDSTITAITGLYNSRAIVNGGFETFCLEKNITFTPGQSYNYTITDGAIPGGVGGGNPDRISIGTAWLYSKFAAGTLADYNYNTTGFFGSQSGGSNLFATRALAAGALQDAFWYLENEITLTASQIAANAFLGLLTSSTASGGANFASLTYAQTTNANGLYNVGVLDLTSLPPGSVYAQDQLTLLPPGGGGGGSVPDGGMTVCLLGMALGGLSLARRYLV